VAVYLDSSAIVKLVVLEPESKALRKFLRGHPSRVASALARVEVLRAVRPHGEAALDHGRQALSRIVLLAVDHDVLDRAAALDRPLRSLDAIHIATALGLANDLDGLVTYDRRMAKVATAAGLRVEAP
jgi:uncharacterized protein